MSLNESSDSTSLSMMDRALVSALLYHFYFRNCTGVLQLVSYDETDNGFEQAVFRCKKCGKFLYIDRHNIR